MMESPEGYYAEHLRGKTKTQIMRKIYELKASINGCKKELEDPEYTETWTWDASTQLCYNRQYLKRAKQALVDMGSSYNPSKEEIEAELFDASIPAISEVTFVLGGSCDKYKIYTVTVEKDYVCFYLEQSFVPRSSNELGELYEMSTKDYFFHMLQYLYLHEWKTYYNNPNIIDGTQWALAIQFSNGHEPFESGGSNAYPYNFNYLLSQFHINSDIIYKNFHNK